MKRQNFNIDSDQEAELETTRQYLRAPTIKDAILRAARLVNGLAKEVSEGSMVMVFDSAGNKTRILLPDIEHGTEPKWKYLCEREHPWRRQLYIKGRKLLASTLCAEMAANGMTPEEVCSGSGPADRGGCRGALLLRAEFGADRVRGRRRKEKVAASGHKAKCLESSLMRI